MSLIAVVIQFCWLFAATDMIAVRGFAVAAGFPIFILAVAVFQVWLAGLAIRRGRIGCPILPCKGRIGRKKAFSYMVAICFTLSDGPDDSLAPHLRVKSDKGDKGDEG
ncbi:hypothetical protein [uncultured Sphingomonas sp.]|uniref:hypothetical protein n=1 Tax=uncultured Sphingomonas sp. TaxID=158754 RepID=UPI0025EA3B7E|nr:hypothetical protein [uncultured Sphingomonas sp.]